MSCTPAPTSPRSRRPVRRRPAPAAPAHPAARLLGPLPADAWTVAVTADCLRTEGKRAWAACARWKYVATDAAGKRYPRGGPLANARGLAQLRAAWTGLRTALEDLVAAVAAGRLACPPGLRLRLPDGLGLALRGGGCGSAAAADRAACWDALAALGVAWLVEAG